MGCIGRSPRRISCSMLVVLGDVRCVMVIHDWCRNMHWVYVQPLGRSSRRHYRCRVYGCPLGEYICTYLLVTANHSTVYRGQHPHMYYGCRGLICCERVILEHCVVSRISFECVQQAEERACGHTLIDVR